MEIKMKAQIIFSTFFLVLLAASVYAQAPITLTHGEFIRDGGDFLGNVNGTFRFQNSDSNISGILFPTSGAGVFTLCDFYGTPCAPGQTIRILDNITGNTALRQDAGFITVNGTPQATVIYSGNLRFSGGTVRIPYYFAKRRTFKMTVAGRLTGTLTGYPTPGLPIPIFTTNFDLSGTVTLAFRRKENGSPAPTYNLTSVIYNFPAH